MLGESKRKKCDFPKLYQQRRGKRSPEPHQDEALPYFLILRLFPNIKHLDTDDNRQ